MKKTTIVAPRPFRAAVACVLALNFGCGKNSNPPASPAETPPPAKTEADPAPSLATNASVAAAPASAASAPAITNLPLAPTTPVAPPATPEPAPTAPAAAALHHTIVEMPATVPAAPTNFYSGDFAAKGGCTADTCRLGTDDNYSLLFRAGYQHVNHGDNNDTYWLSVKFALNGDSFRDRAGKNAWLVPDAYAEFAHQYMANPDNRLAPGSGEGVQFRANFFWPWLHWTSRMFARTNAVCPMCQPLTLGLGPAVNVGFDQLFDGSGARLARYAGARVTINHDGFIEYTAGGTDGLAGTRSQVLTELPFYESHKNGVRYYFRGLWNTGAKNTPDELEAGFFVELPFQTLITPSKWNSLIPGCK